MSDNAIQTTDPKDNRITQLEGENKRLERKVNVLKERLDGCREKRAKDIIRRTPLSAAQAIDIAVTETIEVWKEILDDESDYWFYALLVELMLRDIDTYSAIYSGNELREHVNETTAGDLLKFFRQASMMLDNQPIPEVKDRVLAHDRAIHELVNGRDDGGALRALVRNEPSAAARLAEWRTNIRLAGSEEGKKEWSLTLGRKIADFVDNDHKEVKEASKLAVDYFLSLPVDIARRNDPEQQARVKIANWEAERQTDNARGHYYSWKARITPKL